MYFVVILKQMYFELDGGHGNGEAREKGEEE